MRMTGACDVCEAATQVLFGEWYAYQNTDWVQPIILGEGNIVDCDLEKDANGDYVWTRRAINDHVFYAWSEEKINDEPIIKLHSGPGGGIEFDVAQSMIQLHLTPDQTAALDPRTYVLAIYDRASDAAALGQPILRGSLTICDGHTWFDAASAPPNAAGTTLPPLEAVAVVSALNTREVVLVAGQSVQGVGGGNALLFGAGPPAANVGGVDAFYLDVPGKALYGPKEVTGWPTEPALKQPSLQDVLDVDNTANTDIRFTSTVAGPVLLAPNNDNTRITVSDEGALNADDI